MESPKTTLRDEEEREDRANLKAMVGIKIESYVQAVPLKFSFFI